MSPPRTGRRDVEGLYADHGSLVYAMAMRILKDHQLAEDAAQEAWIRMARQIDEGVVPESEQSWVATFARREALRIAEKRQKPLSLLEGDAASSTPESAPESAVEAKDECERLRRALSSLPQDDREAIRLKYLEDLPPAELRNRLGMASRNGVSRSLRRAMGRLRRAFGRRD